jgi:hypothetical protein
MFGLFDHPRLVLLFFLPCFWIAAQIGSWVHQRRRNQKELDRDDLGFAIGGSLTLLGLIVGFTFSMAVDRYNQRKNYEEQEANAIGTEFVRAGLLPAPDSEKVRKMLSQYLEQRTLWYTSRDERQLPQIDARTAQLQDQLWAATATPLAGQSSAVAALILSGMNDVLNSQGYTQAAWWNRIPVSAWMLLVIISIFCNLIIGYVAHGRSKFIFLILPIVLSVSLFLIADIDSPRRGLIRVKPQNLESVALSIRSR